MISRILMDAAEHPKLFHWNGAPERLEFIRWVESQQLGGATELVNLLATTGGGDLFETETLLAPHPAEFGGDAARENREQQELGLDSDIWLFHVGLILSGYSRSKRLYVALSDSFGVMSSHTTLEEWYIQALREPYREIYGLRSVLPAQSSVAPDGSPSVAPEAGSPSSAPRVNAGIGQTPEGDGGDGKDGQ